MKKILTVLRFPKPPSNISMNTLFQKLIPTVETAIKKAGNDIIGTPIFNLTLTDKQWHILKQVLSDLHAEYTIRREMLLKRLDCTVQSFQVIIIFINCKARLMVELRFTSLYRLSHEELVKKCSSPVYFFLNRSMQFLQYCHDNCETFIAYYKKRIEIYRDSVNMS